MGKNIDTSVEESRTWTAEQARGVVNDLYKSVQLTTSKTIQWYFDKKKWPSRASRGTRAVAILFTVAGGVCPVLQGTLTKAGKAPAEVFGMSFASLGYLLLAVAAAAMLLDKYGGFSTAWIRYVRSGLKLQDQLNVFQMEWQILCATSDLALTGDVTTRITPLLNRLKDFINTVGTIVDAETQEWVTEFQNTLSLLEKVTGPREPAKVTPAGGGEAGRPGVLPPGTEGPKLSSHVATDGAANPQAPNPQAPNPQAPNPQAPNPQAPNSQAPNSQAASSQQPMKPDSVQSGNAQADAEKKT